MPTLSRAAIAWRYGLALVVGLLLTPWAWSTPWLVANFVALAAAAVIIRWRRTHPLLAGSAIAVLGLFPSTGAFWAWAVLSVATRRRWSEIVPVTALSLVVSMAVLATDPSAVLIEADGQAMDLSRPSTWIIGFLLSFASLGVMVAVGMYVGARRDLARSAAERIAQAEREQELRVAQAQADERSRIAREMHDILAHRISLVSMYAGVLAHRRDLPPEQSAEVAETIRSNAALALDELRAVLGQLRGIGDERPQPTLSDLTALVEESRGAGVEVSVSSTDLTGLSPTSSRHAYRIVQESLTNARKHAPGQPVAVSLDGDADTGLTVTISNPLAGSSPPDRDTARLPEQTGALTRGAAETRQPGYGLIGLAERAAAVGGRIEHRHHRGRFEVTAWLPW